MLKQNTKKSTYHLVIIAAMMWGLSPIVYKQSLLIMSIGLFLFGRFTFGAIAIFFSEKHKFTKVPKRLFLPIIIYGLLDGLAVNYLYSIGVQKTSILHVALIGLTVPFFVYYFASLVLGEKVHRVVIGGAAISTMGLFIIFAGSSASNGSSGLAGDALILLCSILNALVIVIARRLLSKKSNKLPAEQLAFIEYALSAVALAIIFGISLVNGSVILSTITLNSILLMVFAGTIVGAIPLVLYYRAAKVLPAERLADTNFIAPFVAILTGIFVLGEQVTPSLVTGAMILLTGLLISNNKINPVLIAHHIYAEEQLLLKMYRNPQKAYAYITKHINR